MMYKNKNLLFKPKICNGHCEKKRLNFITESEAKKKNTRKMLTSFQTESTALNR